jgi:hypothetical protein
LAATNAWGDTPGVTARVAEIEKQRLSVQPQDSGLNEAERTLRLDTDPRRLPALTLQLETRQWTEGSRLLEARRLQR